MADLVVGLRVKPDQADMPRDRFAVEGNPQHRRYVDAGRMTDQLITTDPLDLIDVAFRIWHSAAGMAFDHNVGRQPMQAFVHFAGKTCHHTVDDNQGGDAQRDANDRRQRDISRAKIAKTEKPAIHKPFLRRARIRQRESRKEGGVR